MTVSKRLRFEILRRDNYACRYCGATAPAARLTVDHVIPVTLGGTDSPDNLVTACGDCNAGKTSVWPGSEVIEDVSDRALAWSDAIEKAAAEVSTGRRVDEIATFDACWREWTVNGRGVARDDQWRSTVKVWLDRGLTMDLIRYAVEQSMDRSEIASESKWRYYCGIAWRLLSDIEDRAEALLDPADLPASPDDSVEALLRDEVI